MLQGFIPLVKSASRSRIFSNSHIFDFSLTADEMNQLDSLDECTCLSVSVGARRSDSSCS